MILIYKPDGQDEATRYEFRPGRIRSVQLTVLHKLFRKTMNPQATADEFRLACLAGDPAAKRIMLWHCQVAQHPTLKFDQLDPFDDETSVDLDRQELSEMRERLTAARNVDDDIRAILIARIDDQLAAMDEAGEGAGKAPTTEPSTNTSET